MTGTSVPLEANLPELSIHYGLIFDDQIATESPFFKLHAGSADSPLPLSRKIHSVI
jgi:hypothetical protein